MKSLHLLDKVLCFDCFVTEFNRKNPRKNYRKLISQKSTFLLIKFNTFLIRMRGVLSGVFFWREYCSNPSATIPQPFRNHSARQVLNGVLRCVNVDPNLTRILILAALSCDRAPYQEWMDSIGT